MRLGTAIVLPALLGLFGCDGASVAACFGDVQFCNVVARPIADAGPDQSVSAGDPVVLDGTRSRAGGPGSIQSYAWIQTEGPTVALVDANQPRASFIAPDVAADAVLTFRLTVVDGASIAASNTTRVTVAPDSVMVALQLFDGPLRPSAPWPGTAECPSATDALPADAAAAQRGLWLAGRTLALVKGLDRGDPSQWLDFVRVQVADLAPPGDATAGRLETFGFVLFSSAMAERDPALQQAIVARLAGAPMLEDPAALLASRTRVIGGPVIHLEATADRAVAVQDASRRLLAAQSGCVSPDAALELTAAGLSVIAAAE